MADENRVDEARKAHAALVDTAKQAGAATTSGRSAGGKAPHKGGFGKPAGDKRGYGKPTNVERKFGKPADGERRYGKPTNGEPKFGKPADGERRYGKPTDGERKFGKPADGERRYGKPTDGERKFGKPADGERRYGKPTDGERKFGKPADGERRYGKPTDGERRYGKPADGERKYGKPADGERRYAKPIDKSAPRREGFSPRKPEAKFTQTDETRGNPSRRAAYDALNLVIRQNAYSGLALGRVFSGAHLSGADKALATEIFYGTLENISKLDCVLGQLMKTQPEGAVQDILRMSLYQMMYLERVPENAVCDEAVKLTRALGMENLTGLVNGVLRNYTRKKDEIKLPARADGLLKYLSVNYSMPEFVCERLIAQYGEQLAEEILAHRGGRYMVVRPNTLRISPEEFEIKMTENKLQWEASRVPGAYRVLNMGAVDKNGMYKQGLFSVQGESSLLCAQVVDPKPGMMVLDACAAPGGKSAAMIEMMQGAGRVYSCDIHEHRVELLRAMVARLNHDGIKTRQADASKFMPDWERAMDAVLCDAPCSGLGVLSSKPDIALRITPEELEELPKLQGAILKNCARYVKPGGTLVYSTCTLLKGENQDIVNEFLSANPEFKLDDISKYVPECFAGDIRDGMLALLGCRDDVDGFFIARMVRAK